MVRLVKDGNLSSKAEWTRFCEELDRLPGGLKLWVIRQIRPILGDAATNYIMQWTGHAVKA